MLNLIQDSNAHACVGVQVLILGLVGTSTAMLCVNAVQEVQHLVEDPSEMWDWGSVCEPAF
jgi:hypothetical protein